MLWLAQGSGFRFDGSISLGNIITLLGCIGAAGAAWRDLSWRIKNIETWRREHTEDSKQRDELIRKLDLANEHLTTMIERRAQPRN